MAELEAGVRFRGTSGDEIGDEKKMLLEKDRPLLARMQSETGEKDYMNHRHPVVAEYPWITEELNEENLDVYDIPAFGLHLFGYYGAFMKAVRGLLWGFVAAFLQIFVPILLVYDKMDPSSAFSRKGNDENRFRITNTNTSETIVRWCPAYAEGWYSKNGLEPEPCAAPECATQTWHVQHFWLKVACFAFLSFVRMQCGTIEHWNHVLLAPRDCVKHKWFLLWSPVMNMICGLSTMVATAVVIVATPKLDELLLNCVAFTFLLQIDDYLADQAYPDHRDRIGNVVRHSTWNDRDGELLKWSTRWHTIGVKILTPIVVVCQVAIVLWGVTCI